MSTFRTLMENQIKTMFEFQKTHKVARECIANTRYLLDCVKSTTVNARAVAVIVIGLDPEGTEHDYIVIHGHVAIRMDDDIIEPSYEIAALKNKQYFGSYERYKEFITKHKINEFIDPKEVPSWYTKFVTIAEQINAGTYSNIDEEYYYLQAEYVDRRMKELKLI